MLKRALLTGAALVIGATYMQGAVTPALAGQIKVKPKISVKPKPRIRVVRPKVRIKINPNRLARDKQKKKEKDMTPGIATPPSGTPAGIDTANMPGGDIPGTGGIDAPKTPKLDVRRGFEDIFTTFGGVVPDRFEDLPGVAAFPGYFPGWTPGNELPGGGSFSPQRIAVGNEGPLRAGGGVENPGHSASGGWTHDYTSRRRIGDQTTATWTRETKHGTDYYTVRRTYGPETGTTVTVTIETAGPNGTSNTDQTTTQSTGESDLNSYTRTIKNSDGTGSYEEGLTGTSSPPSQEDGNGDGNPDDVGEGGGTAGTTAPKPVADKKVGNKKIAVGDTKAGGGDQGGNYVDPTYSDRGGSIWTPLGGTVDNRVSPFDKTSQPPPSDVQGTVMVSGGNSGPTLGPEAVTNTGGGDFIAGGGGGGGGGGVRGVDGGGIPCVAVSGGCGGPGGGGGPGPAGLEEPPASN